MGTSLSGLTPATTFDGLLKTSDNEPLDGTLKAISTGDGTDTILDLSTTAFKISGETTIVGNGNDNTTTALLVQNSDGDDILNLTDGALATLGTTGQQGEINLKRPQDGLAIGKIQGTNNGLYLTNQDASNHILIGNSSTRGVSVGDGSASAMGARFGIKGSGATSATTSLLVQNSAGTELFRVRDDGLITLDNLKVDYRRIQQGNNANRAITIDSSINYVTSDGHIFDTYDGTAYTEAMRITGANDQFVGIGETTPTARLQVKGSGNDATTTALLVQNSDGDELLKVDDAGNVTIDDRLGIGSDYIYDVNRIKTSALSIGSNAFYPAASTQVHIKGSGTTSATTALLVQNSAGTDLFKVADNGDINIDNGVAADMKVRISPTANKYLEIDRQGRQVRIYSGATGNAGIFMTQADKFSIGVNNAPLLLLDENSNVRIGSGITSADTSAKLQVDSTTQGFLPPRMTTTERDAIASPAAGLMVYNTTTNKAQCYNGTAWQDLF